MSAKRPAEAAAAAAAAAGRPPKAPRLLGSHHGVVLTVFDLADCEKTRGSSNTYLVNVPELPDWWPDNLVWDIGMFSPDMPSTEHPFERDQPEDEEPEKMSDDEKMYCAVAMMLINESYYPDKDTHADWKSTFEKAAVWIKKNLTEMEIPSKGCGFEHYVACVGVYYAPLYP